MTFLELLQKKFFPKKYAEKQVSDENDTFSEEKRQMTQETLSSEEMDDRTKKTTLSLPTQ